MTVWKIPSSYTWEDFWLTYNDRTDTVLNWINKDKIKFDDTGIRFT